MAAFLIPRGCLINTGHRTLERGDMVATPAYRITVLHPYREFYTLSEDSYSEENSSSLVLKVTGQTKVFSPCRRYRGRG